MNFIFFILIDILMFTLIKLLFITFLTCIFIKLQLSLMIILINNADDIYINFERNIPLILKLCLIIGIYKLLIQN